ncbi:Holliday junction branch migration protein RuvA [Desulfopila sp. IMCC35006]|uniref:Holliday junction branch migration protein RuvA n=1 Tax=Desulfopila sp. IMCC35006 TaxID=2569542 RepID=UPI0010AC85E2|nr:Holliday junction branch migration protein RuvA [Desulfopila sp. IMCC35006]TKB25300.1 Holliday junction branch migration protein RuvA [Desulfopila sp. IMCC35006]
MIATLTGKVFSKGFDRAVVDVAGVGYEVLLSTDCIARMPENGEEAFFYIHTNVREDAITLYGFLEEKEKELFLILKTVSGIGPKLALAMLSGLRVGEICRAISGGDIKRLTTLPGVGKKTAERICVDLKDKVAHLISGSVPLAGGGSMVSAVAGSAAADAISALMNLGYPDSVARGALGKVKKQLGEEAFATQKVEVLIREALRALA